MQPTQQILDLLIDLPAADTTTLAPVAGNKVYLIKEPFTPSTTTDIADLTKATFTGSGAKTAGAGAQQTGRDPLTGEDFIQILEPAGGWTWTCTADPDPAEIIYGRVLCKADDSETYGSELFAEPVPVSRAGDVVAIPYLRLTLTNSPLS